MRQSIYLCWHQLHSEFHSPRVMMGYLLGAVTILGHTRQYLDYAAVMEIQLFEPFILFFMSVINVPLVMLGLFIVLSDAPFVTSRTVHSIYRVTRRKWCRGMEMYMVCQTSVYYIFLWLITIIPSVTNMYMGNVWSRSVFRMAKGDMSAYDYGLTALPMEILAEYRPAAMFVHCFLLVVLYGVALAMLLVTLNLWMNRLIGSSLTLLIYFAGYAVVRSGRISFIPSEITWYRYGVYMLVLVLLSVILHRVVQKADLVWMSAERNDVE